MPFAVSATIFSGRRLPGSMNECTWAAKSANMSRSVTVPVVEAGSMRLRGWIAWVLWGFVHVAFLVGFRNKLGALFGWTWAYVFFNGGTEIISRPFRRADDAPRGGTGTPPGGSSTAGATLRRILRR